MNTNPVNDFLKKIFGNHALLENLKDSLNDMSLQEGKAKTEAQAIKAIVNNIKEEFEEVEIVPNIKFDGNLKLKIAIEVEETIGIDVKMAKSLANSAVNAQKLIGQLTWLKANKYSTHLFLTIVGDKDNSKNPLIQELTTFLESMKINVYYIEILKENT